MNTYDLDDEPCPECQDTELLYIINCGGIVCQNCGKWFDLDGELLEDEQ